MPLRRSLVAALSSSMIALFVAAPACDIASEDCNDNEREDECVGSFACPGSTNTFNCDRATQACVKKPGNAQCVTIPGASASRCPTRNEALSVAGCQTGAGMTSGNAPKCSGDGEDGITVTCHI